MDEQQILATYERIARVTRQMLAAAQAGQWDRLTTLERDCSTLFAPLVEHDRQPPAGADYSRDTSISKQELPRTGRGEINAARDYVRRKAELIRGILADDAQIRLLVEPQLDNLSALLGSTRQKQRLVRAYESDS